MPNIYLYPGAAAPWNVSLKDPTVLWTAGPIGSFNIGDFTALNAFFWSNVDLSAYHGTDSGSTPYAILLTDGAGKHASGYIGAAGANAAEGLDIELGAGAWSNSPSYPYEIWTPGTAPAITHAVNTTGIGIAYKYMSAGWCAVNALYKLVSAVTLASGTNPTFAVALDDGMGSRQDFGSGTLAGAYLTAILAHSRLGVFVLDGVQTDFALSGYSVKRVIDPSNTGVHIISTYNGSTRNWASIDSGFNPNSISTVVVSSAILIVARRGMTARVGSRF